MKQKASLIRALAANSDIVILDEVFRELDLRSEQQAIDLLKKEKGKRTVLLASTGKILPKNWQIKLFNCNYLSKVKTILF